MTLLYFTVDTEYESAFTARHGRDTRRENFDRSIRCKSAEGDVGVFYQLDQFDRHGLKAVYFVDPMPALIWGTEAIADIVGPIIERGHGVQLHLHTEWLAIAGPDNPLGSRTGGNLKDFAFEEQCRLLDWARDTLVAAGAPRPTAFRAGNYGANDDTLRALAETGFTHDSSHCPGIADSACDISLGVQDRHPRRHCGVTEVPIGCIGDAVQGLRHAQLTALSLRELLAVARHAATNEIRDFTVVSHSFELLSRNRKRINKIVKRRFDRFCEGLAAMKQVETATYADRPPAPRPQDCVRPILRGSKLRTGQRMAEQAVANVLYGTS
jgi:hypothetical protein